MNPKLRSTNGSPETHRSISVRQAIALLLTGLAGGALDHWVIHPSFGSSNPPVAHVDTDSAPENRADASVRRLAESRRLFFLSGGPRELTDEEITRRYLEREKERLEARAGEVLDELGVVNADDRASIADAVKAGCTEISNSSGDQVELSPPQSSPPECLISLDEDTGRIWVDPKEYEALSEQEKAAIDLYRKKDFDGFLKQASFEDTRQRLRDFHSKAYPGREAEVRQIFEGLLTKVEQARNAYISGDYTRAQQLFVEVDAFDSSGLPPELQEVSNENSDEASKFFVSNFMKTFRMQIENSLNP